MVTFENVFEKAEAIEILIFESHPEDVIAL